MAHNSIREVEEDRVRWNGDSATSAPHHAFLLQKRAPGPEASATQGEQGFMQSQETSSGSSLSGRARAPRAGRRLPAHAQGLPHQAPRFYEPGATADGEVIFFELFSLQNRLWSRPERRRNGLSEWYWRGTERRSWWRWRPVAAHVGPVLFLVFRSFTDHISESLLLFSEYAGMLAGS